MEETKALEDRKDRYPKAPLMARKALEEGVSKTGIEAIRHLRHVTLQYLEDIGAAEPQKEFSELAFTIANSAHHAFETETEKAVASAYTDILSYFRSFTVADDPSQHLIFLLLLLKSTLQLSLETIIYYEMAMREKLARYAAFVDKVAKRGTILDLLSLSNILEEDLLDLAKKVGPEGIRILTQTRQQVYV